MLLKINEVSELLDVSRGTLYHWVSQRRIPFVRLSARCVRFRRSDIENFIADKVVPANGSEGARPVERVKSPRIAKDSHRAA